MPKDPRADAILQNKAESDPQFAEDMWRFRHPEKDGEKLTLTDVLVELQEKHKLSVSLSTLSSFYKWLSLRRDFAESRNLVYQLKEEMKRDPSISLEAIEKFGVIALATGGIQKKDAKVFSAMMKIGQGRTKLDQNEKRLKQTDKSLENEERRVKLLERKARAADEAAEQMRLLKAGGKLMPEAERTAILDKMDEILGLKK
jgi:hypothetical protein